jgi:hypothetical protein
MKPSLQELLNFLCSNKYCYGAYDRNGRSFLYTKKPSIGSPSIGSKSCFTNDDDSCIEVTDLVRELDGDWESSVVCRDGCEKVKNKIEDGQSSVVYRDGCEKVKNKIEDGIRHIIDGCSYVLYSEYVRLQVELLNEKGRKNKDDLRLIDAESFRWGMWVFVWDDSSNGIATAKLYGYNPDSVFKYIVGNTSVYRYASEYHPISKIHISMATD